MANSSQGNRSLYLQIKRPVEAVIAAGALIVCAPVIAASAVAIFASMGPPVIFRQERAGKNGLPFEILKLRTMNPQTIGEESHDDASRITRLGATLRATSIDELPSLWNVIRGDMSLIGPRPLLTSYNEIYSDPHRSRLRVRPGLTGLAQSSGRNSLSWPERLDLDVEYVNAQSFALDLRIALKTVVAVIRRSGINEEGEATSSALRSGYED